MTIALTFADFLTKSSYADLPLQTIDHAAMLIASTVASAACGKPISSAAIVRELAKERGGAISIPRVDPKVTPPQRKS